MIEKQSPVTENKSHAGALQPVWLMVLSWGVTALLVGTMVWVLLSGAPGLSSAEAAGSDNPAISETGESAMTLPPYEGLSDESTLVRHVNLETEVDSNLRWEVVDYTVQEGDSIFAIARAFNLKPETVLWANFDLLDDDPTYLKPGWVLTIPPVDGIYYKWKKTDDLREVSARFLSTQDKILGFPGNHLDLVAPAIEAGQYVMIPGGSRETKSWITPVAYAPASGATRRIAGAGGCEVPSSGFMGTGSFVWPTSEHSISGFDFMPGHLGIDIAAGSGTLVHAIDNGTVVYAGWNTSGYGNLVVIDHNNGYSSVYAHLNYIGVSCGQNVYQGTAIATSGSTGKSTGPHLHFEIRLNGMFINPWHMLP